MSTRITLLSLTAGTCLLASAQPALGGAHTWVINEVFSSPDGLVQYIELKECCGLAGEVGVLGGTLTSSLETMTIVIPAGLPSGTANRTLLIATQGFADLPGAPTPDMIIPADKVPFFNVAGDTVVRVGYSGLTFGALPADCAFSIHAGNVVAPNTPKNYNFASHWMDSCTPCTGDFMPGGGDGSAGVADLLGVIAAWGPCAAPSTSSVPCVADCAPPAGDGVVGVGDLLAVIGNWGPCK